MSLNKRLQAIEVQIAIDEAVHHAAVATGVPETEILDEARHVLDYFDDNGEWPPDIAWALHFQEDEGRLPTLEEWMQAGPPVWPSSTPIVVGSTRKNYLSHAAARIWPGPLRRSAGSHRPPRR